MLGAVVAPPDAVSALAVGRRLGLPRRVMTILKGESLVNDATALTLFRVFVAAAAGTGATVLGGIGMFVLAAVGGVVVGLAVGWLVHRIRRRLDDPQVESALGLVVPVRRLPARRGRAQLRACSRWSSPGIYLGYRSPESGYATRLQDQAVWQASDTILESVVFALIGLQLTAVVRAAGAGAALIGYGLVVTAAAVLARPSGCSRPPTSRALLFRGIRKNDPSPPWQVPAVISWSGMRGVVTLGRRLRHPAGGPARETLVFLAFFVTVATLLLHGLTLPAVIRLLGVRETTTTADVLAEAQAQQAAAQAGIARLDELTADQPEDSPAGHAAMKLRHITQMRANSAWEQLGRPEAETGEAPSTSLPAAAPRDAHHHAVRVRRAPRRGRDRRRRAAPGDARARPRGGHAGPRCRRAEHPDPFAGLQADCDRCRALCCVGPAFERVGRLRRRQARRAAVPAPAGGCALRDPHRAAAAGVPGMRGVRLLRRRSARGAGDLRRTRARGRHVRGAAGGARTPRTALVPRGGVGTHRSRPRPRCGPGGLGPRPTARRAATWRRCARWTSTPSGPRSTRCSGRRARSCGRPTGAGARAGARSDPAPRSPGAISREPICGTSACPGRTCGARC